MQRSFFLLLFLIGFCPVAMSAEVIGKHLPRAQKVGEGRLTFAFWDVYDAILFAPEGIYDEKKPHALSIRYLMEFKGKEIAKRSIEEMRGQGFTDKDTLAVWNQNMESIFPDVSEGIVLSAVFLPERKTIFYEGNKQIGIVRDAEFTKWFANIWLNEKTSEPQLRKKLLGST